jgi:hypothetical protein
MLMVVKLMPKKFKTMIPGPVIQNFFGVFYVTIGITSIKIFRKYVNSGKTYGKKVLKQ